MEFNMDYTKVNSISDHLKAAKVAAANSINANIANALLDIDIRREELQKLERDLLEIAKIPVEKVDRRELWELAQKATGKQ